MFVAFGIQHAMRMRLIILASVSCIALHYFSTLSHKTDTIFEKKKLIAYKMCFDFLYSFCKTHFSFSEEKRIIVTHEHRSSYKVPVILVRF